jgi:adenine phosphoribosyltransferase
MMELQNFVRSIPDFPKKGIMFRDITTVLKDKRAFADAVGQFHQLFKDARIDKVAAVESRGFIVGGALADRLGAGFVPIRKPGKLPAPKLRQEYELEYGTDAIEIHQDAILPGERILIHDDLLATGGTISAACRLVEQLGGTIVGLAFLIELSFLQPRKKLPGRSIVSLITYDSEE